MLSDFNTAQYESPALKNGQKHVHTEAEGLSERQRLQREKDLQRQNACHTGS